MGKRYLIQTIYFLTVVVKVLLLTDDIAVLTKEAKLLLSLDNKISRLFKSGKKEDGNDLLDSLSLYLDKFKEFDHLVQTNSTFFSDSAFYMLKNGIPLFTQLDLDIKQTIQKFEWDEEKLRLFDANMRGVEELATFFPLHCKDVIYSSFPWAN